MADRRLGHSWRQTPEWEAQVVYVDPRGNVSIDWLPADEVRPIAADQA